MSEQLLAKVAAVVDDLPSLPAVAQEVLALLSDPSTKPERLQSSLSRDPALSLQVLRISNSAYYRRGREITSLADAIVLLGFKTVQSLVMSSAVHRVLSSAGGIASQLWEHCFAVGAACREVAALNGAKMLAKEEAFMVGLFHDVGKGVIATKFPGIYNSGLSAAGETEQIGFNHAELGGVLLEEECLLHPIQGLATIRFTTMHAFLPMQLMAQELSLSLIHSERNHSWYYSRITMFSLILPREME
jgi:HD-like signal output (HDOD) protein